MSPQIKNLLFWLGAILTIVLITIFYQPAAAKTGSLLIWMNNRIYVMDIDTLVLDRIGAVGPDEVIAPSPGCFGQSDLPCWVIAGQQLFQVKAERNQSNQEAYLSVGQDFQWSGTEISWSPDGRHVAYTVLNKETNQAEMRIYDAQSQQVKVAIPEVDPTIEPVWTTACQGGFGVSGCLLAYKVRSSAPVRLVTLTLATNETVVSEIDTDRIFELLWTADNKLLYSQPQRHFHSVEDENPIFSIPSGGQLANVSPNSKYTIYYQPFTLSDCAEDDDCLNLGTWLIENHLEEAEPSLISNFNLAQTQVDALNFIPSWTHDGNSAVFFQNGQLIHYDTVKKEATIWYKPVRGKLRSAPIFSPNEEAVAFVDNQGQGFSEYRLVVINPRLQPIEHIVETETEFRILAWLPQ